MFEPLGNSLLSATSALEDTGPRRYVIADRGDNAPAFARAARHSRRVRLLRIAIRYWASYPTEIDAEIAAADRAEELAEQAWQREQRLLAG